jgi:hypothetical protein
MGRFYSGDIEGKFWFGVQPSDAPSQFGTNVECEPSYQDYSFSEDNIPEVKKRIEELKTKLGDYLPMFDKFFKENNGYNDEKLVEYGFPADGLDGLVRAYADYGLGMKILKCLEENGYCYFEAEL